MSSAPLSSAAIYCRDLVRRVDPDRALLAELAPPAVRPALWSLAAFNWEVARIPDRVSQPMLGNIRRQWWRDAWREMAAGRVRRYLVVEALAVAYASRALPLSTVDVYLDAREAEHDGPPPTLAVMRAQAAATGGALARLEAGVLSQNSDAAEPLGTAWALLWEVRGLAERLKYGRHGLPLDLMTAHDVRFDHAQQDRPPPGLTAVVAAIVAAAETELAKANECGRLGEGYRRLARLYARRLRHFGWQPFDPRVNAPTIGRAWQALLARLSS